MIIPSCDYYFARAVNLLAGIICESTPVLHIELYSRFNGGYFVDFEKWDCTRHF